MDTLFESVADIARNLNDLWWLLCVIIGLIGVVYYLFRFLAGFVLN